MISSPSNVITDNKEQYIQKSRQRMEQEASEYISEGPPLFLHKHTSNPACDLFIVLPKDAYVKRLEDGRIRPKDVHVLGSIRMGDTVAELKRAVKQLDKSYREVHVATSIICTGPTASVQAVKCPEVSPVQEELNKLYGNRLPANWSKMIRHHPMIINGYIGADGRWKYYEGGFRARRFFNNKPHFQNGFTYIEFAPKSLKRHRKQKSAARRRDPFDAQKIYKLMQRMFMWAAEEDDRLKDIIDNMRFTKRSKKMMIDAIISARELNEDLDAPDEVVEVIRDLLSGVEERPTDEHAGALYDLISEIV